MGISEIIDSFRTSDGAGDGVYSVSRPGAQVRTAGVVSAGAPTTFDIVASVQPASGKELKTLAEGRRTEDVRKIFTATVLRTKDVVTISGDPFEVFRVEGPWELDGDVHVEALAARQGV